MVFARPAAESEKNMRKIKDIKSESDLRFFPFTEYMTCPDCGYEIELWSGEAVTACLYCGYRLFRKELTIH